MDKLVHFLQKVDIFSLLSTEEINIVLTGLKFIEIDEGDVLFKQGDEGNMLFIVYSGRVASSQEFSHGNRREIAEFNSGDFFGEMSIFENAPRSATCRAKEKSKLITLHERDYFELILYYPDIAIKIMYRMLNIITERLENTNKFLSEMVQWGDVAKKLAIIDEITGIYNRSYLDNALEEHYEKSLNSQQPFSYIMIDIDDFKQISDNYNMKTINQILNEITIEYKRHLRKQDILARYGGDEFAVILPSTDMHEAKSIAEKGRKSVEKISTKQILGNRDISLTISQGVASYPENAQDLESLLEEADRNLNRAKNVGKNIVI